MSPNLCARTHGIPAAVIEYPFTSGIITSSVVAPFVGEMIKFCVVFSFVYRLPEFDEPVDGIMFAAADGLGFAAVENIFYVLEGGIAVGVLRAIASVPGHMIFSCIWGFALGIAKIPRRVGPRIDDYRRSCRFNRAARDL